MALHGGPVGRRSLDEHHDLSVVRPQAFRYPAVKLSAAQRFSSARSIVTFEQYDMPGMKIVNGIATAGGAKAAWFKDTEGNILALIQTIR